MVEETESIVEGVLVEVDVGLALIREMVGWMRDAVAMGATLCCVVSGSESESSDPVGESLRRFLDPFWFTSLRSLWMLLAPESLKLPESELAMEAAIFFLFPRSQGSI